MKLLSKLLKKSLIFQKVKWWNIDKKYLYSSFVNFVCFLKVRELITLSEFCLSDLFLWEIYWKDCGTFTNRVFLLIFISGNLVLSGGMGFRNGSCGSSIYNWPRLARFSISIPPLNTSENLLGYKSFRGL